MASAEFQFDTRIRRYYVPLKSQQRRLRHLRSISARNVIFSNEAYSIKSGLYYTLHHEPNSSPFYTSEVISDSLNPIWKDFEPSNFPSTVPLSSAYITVRMWASAGTHLLVEWLVFFAGLHFLGKQIPKEGKQFKTNILIFGMVEGYYGCEKCQENVQENLDFMYKDSISTDVGVVRTSCAFSTLGRIRTFERVISQIQASASKWKKNIEAKLLETEELHQTHSVHELMKMKVSMLQLEVNRQKYYLKNLEKQGLSIQEKLHKDVATIKTKYDELKRNKEKLTSLWQNFWEFRESLLKIEAQLLYRQKELITDLGFIYPVIQFPDHKGYSIHNVHLPNSENLTGHDEMMISVALGYVCHVLLMISQFLNVPLRYEVSFSGSRSNIIDHISTTIPVKTRTFPLFSKGKDKRFFEYAVYLLNKNIAQLRMLFGLITKELSATLPNLHSLIDQRLALTGDSSPLSSTNIIGILENAKAAQNGLLYDPESLAGISRQAVESSEIEHLRKEMAEMLPDNVKNSNSNKIIPRWTNEANNVLCCSLDKGLDDIKVLEKSSEVFLPKAKDKLPMKKIAEAFHHSSYPNLNTCLQSVEESTFSDTVNTNSQLQSEPLKMWIASGSQTNSEDEPIEDNFQGNVVQVLSTGDSQFYVGQNWTGSNDASSTVSPTQSAMLEDFGDDLTLRTEELANRSSSFQLQKVGSLGSDPSKN